eukprot:gene19886-48794_t
MTLTAAVSGVCGHRPVSAARHRLRVEGSVPASALTLHPRAVLCVSWRAAPGATRISDAAGHKASAAAAAAPKVGHKFAPGGKMCIQATVSKIVPDPYAAGGGKELPYVKLIEYSKVVREEGAQAVPAPAGRSGRHRIARARKGAARPRIICHKPAQQTSPQCLPAAS